MFLVRWDCASMGEGGASGGKVLYVRRTFSPPQPAPPSDVVLRRDWPSLLLGAISAVYGRHGKDLDSVLGPISAEYVTEHSQNQRGQRRRIRG